MNQPSLFDFELPTLESIVRSAQKRWIDNQSLSFKRLLVVLVLRLQSELIDCSKADDDDGVFRAQVFTLSARDMDPDAAPDSLWVDLFNSTIIQQLMRRKSAQAHYEFTVQAGRGGEQLIETQWKFHLPEWNEPEPVMHVKVKGGGTQRRRQTHRSSFATVKQKK
jgi:hypothetical protein